jgi:hypothetical protein
MVTDGPDSYDGAGVRLMADIIQANSDSLARTTNTLLSRVEEERDQYAEMLIDFHAKVRAATEVVTTRDLEHLLWVWEEKVVRVARALEMREELR